MFYLLCALLVSVMCQGTKETFYYAVYTGGCYSYHLAQLEHVGCY